MSIQGRIFIDIVGLFLMLAILNLIRTKKLHVAYAVVWFSALTGVMAIVSIPGLLSLLPKIVGAIFPASAISLIAFIFIFIVLIFFSVQLSILSSRQTELIQALAIRDLQLENARAGTEKKDPPGEEV